MGLYLVLLSPEFLASDYGQGNPDSAVLTAAIEKALAPR